MTLSTTNDDAVGAEIESSANSKEAYDVVICGTDLIQSILSSALSRAGKKVLHCDGNEWYGGFDAVLYGGSTLDLFIEGCEQVHGEDMAAKNWGEANKDGDLLQLPLLPRHKYGDLRLHSRTRAHTNKAKDNDVPEKLDDTEPRETEIEKLSIGDGSTEMKEGIYGNVSDLCNEVEQDTPTENDPPSTQQPTVNPLENGFCFDITSSLLYASGDAVENLVKSGVSDYLEFKSLKGLYLLMEEETSSVTRSGRRGRNTGRNKSKDAKSEDGIDSAPTSKKLASYRVPCSKGDVFKSRLLSPVDKRRLMKFLQLITDYGMASQLEEGESPNNTSEDTSDKSAASEEESAPTNNPKSAENEVKPDSGVDAVQTVNERHLHRGRALSRPQNKATPSSSEMDALLHCINDNTSFSDFLTKVAKLPERLSTVVIYALALAPFGHSELTGDEAVNGAMNICQYSTQQGVDDLVRHLTALGRFGDTAFLVPMYGFGELSQAFCRSGAVYGSTYMLRRSPLAISLDKESHVKGIVLGGEEHIGGISDLDTDDVSDRCFSCQHVIVPNSMMMPKKESKKSQMRTYRRISILLGKLMIDQDQIDSTNGSDTEQRYAIIIPPGTHGLKNTSAIHGVAVDDSAFVTPAGKNYTLLHLTTCGEECDVTSDEVFVDTLSKAVDYLIASQTIKDGEAVEECHHLSFSYTIDAPSPTDLDGTSPDHTSGLHVCNRDMQSLTCDAAFREAKQIFENICPDAEFLEIAKKVEDAIVYRDEHESDDEKGVLESACTMIQTPAVETPPAEGKDGETS